MANAVDGTYTVTASVAGFTPASFVLSNTPLLGDFTIFLPYEAPTSFYNGGPVELGVRFMSEVAGVIKGVRFYKAAGDNTVHTGSLWTNNGQTLATGTFGNESGSGWQTLTFNNPVPIAANTTYVASYHTSGAFPYTWYTFQSQGIDRPPLHGLKDGVDGANGLFLYGAGGAMPTNTYASSNYWVDVVFSAVTGPSPVPTTIQAVSGTPQSAGMSTPFAQPLKAKVLDQNSQPMSGVTVTFAAPSSGASAVLTPLTAVTGADGTASTSATANGIAGGPYNVTASVTGIAQPAVFSLTNTTVDGQPKTIFGSNGAPTQSYNGGPVELGVRFRADSSGTIQGVKFYKAAGDASTHTGSLWTNNGQLLATGTFANETASGWQTLTFSSPVAITANTTYVASYHTGGAFYYTWYTFQNQGVDNPPLHALKDGVDGGNGLYLYGAGGVMPTNTYASSNYWVDVLFVPGPQQPPVATTIQAVSGAPQTATISTAFAQPLKAKVLDQYSQPMSGVTVTFAAPASGASAVLTPLTAVTGADGTASTSVTANATAGGPYTVTASATGIAQPATFSLTNTSGTAQPKSIFGGSDTPTQSYNGGPVELGVRFRADSNGSIQGVKFYKPAGDSSTHTGSLWTNNGQLLATGTFTNETASGWQTLTFNNPVAIVANTTYVASYHTGGAFYYTWYTFQNAGVDNPPLHALKDGVDGANGIYLYGAGGSMPTNTYASSNYWVDVVFSAGDTPPPQPSAISVVSGTPQSTTRGTSFQSALKAKVTGANNSPVPNVTVSFTAPASGASATFNGVATTTAVTDAAGIATSPVPVANGVDGTYNVVASVSGLAPTATFSLTNSPPSTDQTIFTVATVPNNYYNGGPVELGVRFRSDTAGQVKGIRFFKSAADSSAHTGSLWTNAGVLLATGTFSNETASGWQMLTFSNPVTIAANTTYVASYHTSGGFLYEWYTFQNAGVDHAPLHALKDGLDGANGLYLYGAGGAMPTNSYASSNYWVDVVFTAAVSNTTYDGQWSGTTAQGKAISFVVSNGVVSNLSYGFRIVGTGGCVLNGTTTATAMSVPIAGSSFAWAVGVTNITGNFSSPAQASGTLTATQNIPLVCSGSMQTTWTATRQ